MEWMLSVRSTRNQTVKSAARREAKMAVVVLCTMWSLSAIMSVTSVPQMLISRMAAQYTEQDERGKAEAEGEVE